MNETLLPDLDVVIPPNGLTISEAARATGTSIDTLRYYERAGLLLDPAPRNHGGQRRYWQSDVAWVAGLVMLRETGMSIADIRQIADLSREPGTEAARLAAFVRHRDRVVRDLERSKQHLLAIEAKIAAYQRITALPALGESR